MKIFAVIPIFIIATSLALFGSSSGVITEEQTFLGLINTYRAEHGSGPLALNSQLVAAANWMSWDMAMNDYFSHTDSLGRSPFDRLDDFGYDADHWRGENLGAGNKTAQATFENWKASPGHNANMLRPEFAEIGISRTYGLGTIYGWYWATEFGGPRSEPVVEPPVLVPTPTPIPTTVPVPTPKPSPPCLESQDDYR